MLDTNVLIQDPDAIEKLEQDVLIHICVVHELDRLKNEPLVGISARHASRQMEAHNKAGFLKDGMSKKGGGKLFIDARKIDFSSFPFGLEETNDNRIVLSALRWQKEHPEKQVVIKSNDVNVRIVASSVGIPAEEYLYERGIPTSEKQYSGSATVELIREFTCNIFSELCKAKVIAAKTVFDAAPGTQSLLPNQCCYLQRPGGETVLAIYDAGMKKFWLVGKPSERRGGEKIHPINKEQAFAYALLTNPAISLVTLRGKTGSGKTLMALAAGYEQVGEDGLYEQILVFRPNIEIGQRLGYLPGTLDEKFSPWMQPIIDNFHLLIRSHKEKAPPPKSKAGKGKKTAEDQDPKGNLRSNFYDFREQGLIEISPINFIRGSNLHKRFIIVDEAQNLSPHEIKTMVARAGVGTKVVLTGDTEQIDNRFLNSVSNGLSYVIEKFRGQTVFGHITLEKTERSRLAELAAQLL